MSPPRRVAWTFSAWTFGAWTFSAIARGTAILLASAGVTAILLAASCPGPQIGV